MRTGAVLAVLLAAVACDRGPAPSADAQPVHQASVQPALAPAPKPEQPATLRGVVRWKGPTLEPSRIIMSGDDFAVAAWPDGWPPDPRFEVAEGGGLPNTFVWAAEGPHKGRNWDTPATPAELGAERRMFVPHVLGVQCGQPIEFRTRDGQHYNFHARPKVNRNQIDVCVEERGVWATGHSKYLREPNANVFRFEQPELAIPVYGNLLSWMSAWICVVDHPFFAVTDASGHFEIRGLPPGDYVFKVWHEGTTAEASLKGHMAETKVTLASGAETTVDFDLR